MCAGMVLSLMRTINYNSAATAHVIDLIGISLVDEISRMNNCITAAGRWATGRVPPSLCRRSPSLADVSDRKVLLLPHRSISIAVIL